MFDMFDGPTHEELVAAAEKCATDRASQLDAVKSALVENACDCWAAFGQHMVGKVVVVAEVIDETGDANLLVLDPDDQPTWDSRGLLATALDHVTTR